MNQAEATEQARIAAHDHAKELSEALVQDKVQFYVVERLEEGRLYFVIDSHDDPDMLSWESYASAVESSTHPGVFCAHLRTGGGGRNDSTGAVCAVPGIWFPLF